MKARRSASSAARPVAVILMLAAAATARATGGPEAAPTIPALAGATITGPAGAPFFLPTDAAVGGGGRLYVLDGTRHRVVSYDSEGRPLGVFGARGHGPGELLDPLGIATGPGGRVYVADSGNHRVAIFTATGEAAGEIPLAGAAAGSRLPDPTDVAVDPAGDRLYVADNDHHRVLVCSLEAGGVTACWGRPGRNPLEFRYPFLLDTDPRGYLLVVEPINTRVQVLNRQGKFVSFLGAWGIRPGQLFRPKGVAACDGRVFVTDSYLGKVQAFDLRGRFFGVVAGEDGEPVHLTTPTGIAADRARRRLYVVELKANRVRRLDLR